MTREDYLTLRRIYEPKRPKLIIVAESPPASGLYFYDPTGAVTEPLFAALMKQAGILAATKEAGLRAFQRKGWVLADATYEPVNELVEPARNKVIVRDYPLLKEDLETLMDSGRPTPLVLIKANVCRILEDRLTKDGFNVLNHGVVVPFPSTGHQHRFHEAFAAILGGVAAD